MRDDQKECFVEGYDYDYDYDSFYLPGAVFKSQFALYLVLFLYPLRSLILVATFPCFTPGGRGAGGLLVTWVNFCWVCTAGLSECLPHNSLFCGHIVDPILVTLGKKKLSQSQLSHFLFMHQPYKAF